MSKKSLKKEMEILNKFPLIAQHKIASNMFDAISLCREGIKTNNECLFEILEGPSPTTSQEHKEYLCIIDHLVQHITFCENALYEAENALNDLKVILN